MKPCKPAEAARLHALAMAGDIGARNELVASVWPLCLRLAIDFADGPAARRVGLDGDDLATEAVIVIVEKLGAYRPDVAEFTTWAGRVCRRVFLTRCGLGNRGRIPGRVRVGFHQLDEHADEFVASKSPDPATVAEVRDSLSALRFLDARSRSAVVMRYVEGHSVRDVARQFGVNKKRASRIVNNALDKLHARLGPDR